MRRMFFCLVQDYISLLLSNFHASQSDYSHGSSYLNIELIAYSDVFIRIHMSTSILELLSFIVPMTSQTPHQTPEPQTAITASKNCTTLHHFTPVYEQLNTTPVYFLLFYVRYQHNCSIRLLLDLSNT